MRAVNSPHDLRRRLSATVRSRGSDILLLGSVTVIGAVLRIEALVGSYGPVPLGSALERFQQWIASLGRLLHGGRLEWPVLGPRSGDPVAYLNNARAMTWFYEGRAREPVFNYATKLWLGLTADADIGVSAASTLFSILCVPAAYLLGRLAFGRLAGILAALLVAIDSTVIGWGVQGWRDDAFTLSVLLFGVASLLFLRTPSMASASGLGLAASFALLTRLTAASFIGPVLALLAIQAVRVPDPEQRNRTFRGLALAATLAVVLVGPYLFNCWQRLGDPLAAINRNTIFYRERAGLDATEEMSVDNYLALLARDRPVATVDTALQGVTTYPFRNKFHTLAPWGSLLPSILPGLAIAGLLPWPWTPQGRLLLLMLAFSLVPYAFTWEIRGGAEWRFTMHAYPFYLLAAASLPAQAASFARHVTWNRVVSFRYVTRAGASVAIAAGLWLVLLWLPYPRLREALQHDGEASVSPGWRDNVFFVEGWDDPVEQRGLARTSRTHHARVRLPLQPGVGHRIALQIAPAAVLPGEPLFLRAYVNGQQLAWKQIPEQWGELYEFDVDPAIVGRPDSTLELRANRVPTLDSGRNGPLRRDSDDRITLWWIGITVDGGPP